MAIINYIIKHKNIVGRDPDLADLIDLADGLGVSPAHLLLEILTEENDGGHPANGDSTHLVDRPPSRSEK